MRKQIMYSEKTIRRIIVMVIIIGFFAYRVLAQNNLQKLPVLDDPLDQPVKGN